MNNLAFVLLLFFCMSLTSCGPTVSRTTSHEAIFPITEEELILVKSRQDFFCDSLNGGHCPAGIGRILVLNIANRAKTKTCSGFLVSGNKLITNNHCVATSKECQNAVVAVYDGTSSKIVGCNKVLVSKLDSVNSESRGIDFSVLELDQEVNSEILPIAEKSATPGDEVTLWAVDQLNVIQARISEFSCNYGTKKASMELNKCPAIPGNSGSPILNSDGEVVGLLWGGTSNNGVTISTPLDQRRSKEEMSVAVDIAAFRDYL